VVITGVGTSTTPMDARLADIEVVVMLCRLSLDGGHIGGVLVSAIVVVGALRPR
jgi:hypothetical protein